MAKGVHPDLDLLVVDDVPVKDALDVLLEDLGLLPAMRVDVERQLGVIRTSPDVVLGALLIELLG